MSAVSRALCAREAVRGRPQPRREGSQGPRTGLPSTGDTANTANVSYRPVVAGALSPQCRPGQAPGTLPLRWISYAISFLRERCKNLPDWFEVLNHRADYFD